MSEMFVKDLVSIITPCYNGEKTLFRLLDSILGQTYPHIEYIFVNDGSTDDTERVFFSYRERMEERGILVKYVVQENRGVGGAINSGLKVFTGEYLAWIDADDYLSEDSVEKRVACMREHPDCAIVTSDACMRNGIDLTVLGYALEREQDWQGRTLFEKMLRGESVFFPGCHLVRSEAFVATHPDRSIYPARRGQNWQMLLPMYYAYKRFLLREPLFHYLVFPNSLSKDHREYDKIRYRYEEHETILTETLRSMQMEETERAHYLEEVHTLYARRRLQLAANFGNRADGKLDYCALKRLCRPTMRDRVYRLIAVNRFANWCYRKLAKNARKSA